MTSSCGLSEMDGGTDSGSSGVSQPESASLWLKAVADRCLARLRTSAFSGLPANGQDQICCGGQTKPVGVVRPTTSGSVFITQEGAVQARGQDAIVLGVTEDLDKRVSQDEDHRQCLLQSRSALLSTGARGEPPRKKYCSAEDEVLSCSNKHSYDDKMRFPNLQEPQRSQLCGPRGQASSTAKSDTDTCERRKSRFLVTHEESRRHRRHSTLAESTAPSIVDSWLSFHQHCDSDRCVTQIRDIKCGLSDAALIYSEHHEVTVILDDLDEMKRSLLKIPRASTADKVAITAQGSQNGLFNFSYCARAQISLSRRLVPGRSVRGIVLFHSRFLGALVIRITAIERTARNQQSHRSFSGLERDAVSETFQGTQPLPLTHAPGNTAPLERRSVLLEAAQESAFGGNMQRLSMGPPCLIAMVVLGSDQGLTTTTVSKIEGALVRGVVLDAHETSNALISVGRRGKDVFNSTVTSPKQGFVTECEDSVHHCLKMRLLYDITCCPSDPSLVWGKALLKAFGAGSVVAFTFPKGIGGRVGRDNLKLPLGVLLSFRTLHFTTVRGAALDKRETEMEDFSRRGMTSFSLGSLLEKDSRMTNPAAIPQRLLYVGLEACGSLCSIPVMDGCSVAALPAATLLLPSASLKRQDPSQVTHTKREGDTEVAQTHMSSVLRCMTDRLSQLLYLRRLPRSSNDQLPIRDRVAGACSIAWSNQLLFAAILSVRQGSFAYAVEQCDAALSHYPQNGDALVVRGAAKANLKRYEEAIKDFDDALAFNPDNVNAQRYRLKTVHRMGLGNRFTAEGFLSESRMKNKDGFDPSCFQREKCQSSSLVPTSGFCFNWEDEEARLSLYGQKKSQ